MILADILLNPGELINNCDWVFCMVLVPPGNQFIAGFADGFAVENGAAEDARDIQAVVHGRVGAEGDSEVTIEIDGGRTSLTAWSTVPSTRLVARKHPSPLVNGQTKLWAAGIFYTLGQVNFLFDKSNHP